jgi:hypothetical protein
MRKLVASVLFLLVCLAPTARAQASIVPAGTLLRCVIDDPNFSPKTAEIGDPVICRLSPLTEFGHSVFPRGSYLGGRLEADKEPGHFVGKGYMKIVFDHIGMPNTDEELYAKMVAAQGQKVDKQGDIVGQGHAKRDVIEWMIPPLWPWKVITLPARGPEPTLKNEEVITLRLMEDIEVPQFATHSSPSSPWHQFSPTDPSMLPQRQSYIQPSPVRPSASPLQENVSFGQNTSGIPAPQLAVLVMRSQMMYQMTDYWVADRLIYFVLPDGRKESTDVDNVDWRETGNLNAERGVRLTLRTRPES